MKKVFGDNRVTAGALYGLNQEISGFHTPGLPMRARVPRRRARGQARWNPSPGTPWNHPEMPAKIQRARWRAVKMPG